ncbi:MULTISPECIES: hypothetical protein [Streptosporangium]|uniref:Core-binding (CB) domain-containing protein n=1 Tax=Streptosporangium brasiliense TaxID=47480 RepID=A0ABT9RJA7_9ACTN|nr:hypothetical protein [Streptosporangium brasiliense]MDP9868912.1 hypothetical protein [Streptosporangium brasiliense]
MSAAPKITALHGGGVTLAEAADAFLATARTANPNTHHAYASAIDRTIERLGRDRPLADVADAEIGAALTELWGRCAPATWNRNRAAVTSWLTWCQTKKHWAAPSVPADAERRKETADETRAVAKTTIHRLLPRRDIPLREKTLWRMLYETRGPGRGLIMGKTRHKNPRTAMRYVNPGPEAIAKVIEVLTPRRRTH